MSGREVEVTLPLRGLVFRCSCGGQVVVPHGSPGGAEKIVAAVRQAHLDVGHHEVDVAEFRRTQALRQGAA